MLHKRGMDTMANPTQILTLYPCILRYPRNDEAMVPTGSRGDEQWLGLLGDALARALLAAPRGQAAARLGIDHFHAHSIDVHGGGIDHVRADGVLGGRALPREGARVVRRFACARASSLGKNKKGGQRVVRLTFRMVT